MDDDFRGEKAGPARRSEMTGCDMYQVCRYWQLTRSPPFAGEVNGTFRAAPDVLMSGGGPIPAPDRAPLGAMAEGRAQPTQCAIPRAESSHSSGRPGWLDPITAVGVACIKAWPKSRGSQPTDSLSEIGGGAPCAQPLGSHPRGPQRGAGTLDTSYIYARRSPPSRGGHKLACATLEAPRNLDAGSLPRHWDD